MTTNKKPPALPVDHAGARSEFRQKFETSAQKKALKALDMLNHIMTNGRAEMARVAAARAIIDKAVPSESNLSVAVAQLSYADTLRALAARMRTPIQLDLEIDPAAPPLPTPFQLEGPRDL